MRIAITGASGFLGWHTACRLRALHEVAPVRIERDAFAGRARLADAFMGVDAVLHLAGVNRGSNSDVRDGNIHLAEKVAGAVRTVGSPLAVVYANSIQADLDNPYGNGKAVAANLIMEAVNDVGGQFTDLLLPNLFGEHGRPNYNSFVATFAHEVAAGRTPTVTGDREINLLHVQDAAHELISAIGHAGRRRLAGEPRGISVVLRSLQIMHEVYAQRGELPPLLDDFAVNLFNTYRAAAFPGMWPLSPAVHSDSRGALFETVRMRGGTGQAFVSITTPGKMRGEHYHLRKVERFFVVKGEAEISLRRLLTDEVVRFRLSGDRPSYVDMPTMWVHNIRNVGDGELVTMFWSDQLFDPSNPDQYPEEVDQS